MTQEEKAKAYDEAIKKAREIAANPNRILHLDDFEELFPGITDESEDERIRKQIVGILKRLGDGNIEIPKNIADIFTWLEKQKEQKPIKVLYIPKFRKGDAVVSTNNPRLTYQILDVGNINELGNPEYKVEIFTDGKPDEPRNIKYIEVAKMDDWGKLIEQKPAKWSEEHIADVFEKVGLAKIVREQGNDALTNALQGAMLELSKMENTE